MTSTPPENPPPASPDQPSSSAPEASTVEHSAVPPTGPGGAYPGGPHPGGPYGSYGQHPFAPVAREPRVPWVNPERRSHILGAGILAGLVLLAAGFGIGYGVAPSGHGRHGDMRMERGGYFPGRMLPGPGGQFPGNGQRRLPGAPAPTSPAVPATPTPTSTK
jgi:hypothetical protein